MSTHNAERIMDAAEERLRGAGYNGFSFRDLADDVGIKSASVHYHFPTKEALVARLVERYGDRFLAALDAAPQGPGRIGAVRDAFRSAVGDELKMCLCGVLGAERFGLPDTVARATHKFFVAVVDRLAMGLEDHCENPRSQALRAIAQLEGAALLARAHNDLAVFDQAAAELPGES